MTREGNDKRDPAGTVGVAAPCCDDCPMRGLAFCATLGPRSQAVLRQMSSRVPVASGETLAEEGQHNTPFQIVVKGVVELSKRLPDGRRQVMGFRFPGELVTVPCPDIASRVTVHAIAHSNLFIRQC